MTEINNKDNLLNLMNQRLERAKRFTKETHINEVKRNVDDYNAQPVSVSEMLTGTSASRMLQEAANKRYEVIPPIIFVNTEAAKSELFDRTPDIILTGRGKEDSEKAKKIDAVYEYLKELLDIESKSWEAGHWFVLTGFCDAQVGYKTESHTEPLIDPETGEPILDEMGEPVMQEVIDYDDPTLNVSDPLKTYYSPSSEFDYDAKGVDYRIYCKPISLSEAKELYNDDDLKADYKEEYDDENDNQDKTKETHKALIHYYCGTIPEENKDDVENWKADKIYSIAFTNSKLLDVEEKERRPYRLGRWYAHPNKFFGFGFGTIGRPFQREKAIRTGQRIRLADIAAFPKYTVKNDGKNKINPNDVKDPRENQLLLYETEAPGILQPGNLADVVTAAEERAESDAQAAFGLLDISANSQQSTVDTATGQTIFAEASARRMRMAKKIFMKFYRELVVELFKQCQENWTSEKLISITDEHGEEQEIVVSPQDLSDIDFEKDLKIDAESVSVNKDVIRAQIIALYNMVQADPLVNRRTMIKEVMKRGFEISDPERFLNESDVEPGTQLVNPQTGEAFTIDEGGQLVPQEDIQDTVEQPQQAPEVPGVPEMPTGQEGVMGGMQGKVSGQSY
jgi:hypothetical protein